jgi:hypothetical protein
MVMLLDVACTQLALQVLLHAEHHGFPSLSADCSENRAIRRRNVKPTFSGYMGKWEAAQHPMHSEVKFLKLHEIETRWIAKIQKRYSSKLQIANVEAAKY